MLEILLVIILAFAFAFAISAVMSKLFFKTYKPDQTLFLNYFMLSCSIILLKLIERKYGIYIDYLDATLIFLVGFAMYSIMKRVWSGQNAKFK